MGVMRDHAFIGSALPIEFPRIRAASVRAESIRTVGRIIDYVVNNNESEQDYDMTTRIDCRRARQRFISSISLIRDALRFFAQKTHSRALRRRMR
jgi:hypothetical protein